MNFNINISNSFGTFNILVVDEEKVGKVVDAYLRGETKFTLVGETYSFGKNVRVLRIFESKSEFTKGEITDLNKNNGILRNLDGSRCLDPVQLLRFGDEFTEHFVGDRSFGSEKEKKVLDNEKFISQTRIEALEEVNGKCQYDLSKLIYLCKEINDNYVRRNYFSVALLLRTILNHVPPAFNGKESFEQVLAELNGSKHKTKKEILTRLHELQRKFADLLTHERLREFEPEMTLHQVSFIPEVDYLLQEVVTELKKQ